MSNESRTVRLNTAQLEFIARADFLPLDLREAVERESECARGSQLNLGENTADRLQTAFTARLAEAGFDEQYSLKEEGVELEALIDALRGE